MAGNDLLHVLRASNDTIATSTETLQAGQLLYNKTYNYLTAGSGSDPLSKLPIAAREVVGFTGDSQKIVMAANKGGEFHLKYRDNSLELLTPDNLVIKSGDSDLLSFDAETDIITFWKSVDVSSLLLNSVGDTAYNKNINYNILVKDPDTGELLNSSLKYCCNAAGIYSLISTRSFELGSEDAKLRDIITQKIRLGAEFDYYGRQVFGNAIVLTNTADGGARVKLRNLPYQAGILSGVDGSTANYFDIVGISGNYNGDSDFSSESTYQLTHTGLRYMVNNGTYDYAELTMLTEYKKPTFIIRADSGVSSSVEASDYISFKYQKWNTGESVQTPKSSFELRLYNKLIGQSVDDSMKGLYLPNIKYTGRDADVSNEVAWIANKTDVNKEGGSLDRHYFTPGTILPVTIYCGGPSAIGDNSQDEITNAKFFKGAIPGVTEIPANTIYYKSHSSHITIDEENSSVSVTKFAASDYYYNEYLNTTPTAVLFNKCKFLGTVSKVESGNDLIYIFLVQCL